MEAPLVSLQIIENEDDRVADMNVKSRRRLRWRDAGTTHLTQTIYSKCDTLPFTGATAFLHSNTSILGGVVSADACKLLR